MLSSKCRSFESLVQLSHLYPCFKQQFQKCVILLSLPSIMHRLWQNQYFLVFYFRAECSSVWNNLQKEIKMLSKSDPVDVTKCIYFKLSSCKDEIQQRGDSFVYKAKEHLQVHLEETLGSCVLCSVFTGLLLLVTERQDARTGQEILFFPLSMRVF